MKLKILTAILMTISPVMGMDDNSNHPLHGDNSNYFVRIGNSNHLDYKGVDNSNVSDIHGDYKVAMASNNLERLICLERESWTLGMALAACRKLLLSGRKDQSVEILIEFSGKSPLESWINGDDMVTYILDHLNQRQNQYTTEDKIRVLKTILKNGNLAIKQKILAVEQLPQKYGTLAVKKLIKWLNKPDLSAEDRVQINTLLAKLGAVA